MGWPLPKWYRVSLVCSTQSGSVSLVGVEPIQVELPDRIRKENGSNWSFQFLVFDSDDRMVEEQWANEPKKASETEVRFQAIIPPSDSYTKDGFVIVLEPFSGKDRSRAARNSKPARGS